MRNRRPRSGWRREDTPKGRPQCRNTAQAKRRAVRRHGTPPRRRRGAHEARALCAKQRGVSPMKQGVPQASLRAQWYDHAELRNGAKRKNAFPSRSLAVEGREAAGGASTRSAQRRNTGPPTAAQCEDKQSGNLARKPQVCQRSVAGEPAPPPQGSKTQRCLALCLYGSTPKSAQALL